MQSAGCKGPVGGWGDGDELKNSQGRSACEGVEWIHLAQHTVPV
jgi:hypothetical protein